MTATKQPWLVPGYKFLTDEARAWVDHARLSEGVKASKLHHSQDTSRGVTLEYGRGTIPGLGKAPSK